MDSFHAIHYRLSRTFAVHARDELNLSFHFFLFSRVDWNVGKIIFASFFDDTAKLKIRKATWAENCIWIIKQQSSLRTICGKFEFPHGAAFVGFCQHHQKWLPVYSAAICIREISPISPLSARNQRDDSTWKTVYDSSINSARYKTHNFITKS